MVTNVTKLRGPKYTDICAGKTREIDYNKTCCPEAFFLQTQVLHRWLQSSRNKGVTSTVGQISK